MNHVKYNEEQTEMYLTPIKYSVIWPVLMINGVNYANTHSKMSLLLIYNIIL